VFVCVWGGGGGIWNRGISIFACSLSITKKTSSNYSFFCVFLVRQDERGQPDVEASGQDGLQQAVHGQGDEEDLRPPQGSDEQGAARRQV
jgi:hypothetical protein